MAKDIITRIPNGKSLSVKWLKGQLNTVELTPGTCLKSKDMMNPDQWAVRQFMNDGELWQPIMDAFPCTGTNAMVAGRFKTARFYAFSFKGKTILCITESSDQGTIWELLVDETGRKNDDAIYAPSDSRVIGFWPSFCAIFSESVLRVAPGFKPTLC
jgi:hypothetical protein